MGVNPPDLDSEWPQINIVDQEINSPEAGYCLRFQSSYNDISLSELTNY